MGGVSGHDSDRCSKVWHDVVERGIRGCREGRVEQSGEREHAKGCDFNAMRLDITIDCL